jgi:hypothetical protein
VSSVGIKEAAIRPVAGRREERYHKYRAIHACGELANGSQSEAGTHHGRWNRYVDIRKRTMKAGEADVGMNRSGNQLRIPDQYGPSRVQSQMAIPPKTKH